MRSRDARHLAERALITLATALGDHTDQIVVIGGLNADLLTDAPAAAHQGTVDVDLLVQVGFTYERDELDLGWIERGLRDASFEPFAGDETWRWFVRIDGVPVKVELLCDTPDNRGQQIVLPGCAVATAMNLAGPSAAAAGVPRQLIADEVDAEPVTIRFASLGGYLLAKAAAVVGRGLDKDLYDLAFVLLHNSDGSPASAGEAACAALPEPAFHDHARDLRAALRLFVDPDAAAPLVYATQRIHDGEDVPVEVLAQDAISAALECRDAFERRVVAGRARA